MIKRITIRDVASYDSEGVVFDDLQKVNFVFGGNGTGKTTISKLLASKTPAEDFPRCYISWEGMPMETVVYNKNFRDRNFRENIPGVFTLGEDSVEAVNELEQLREKRVDLAHKTKEVDKKKNAALLYLDIEHSKITDLLCNKGRPYRKELSKCLEGGLQEQLEEEVKQSLKTIKELDDSINKMNSELDELKKSYEKIGGIINSKEEKLSSVQPTIDNINRLLKKSGFTGFSIQPSGNHKNYYQIQREDGRLALNTLSEGEVTFITFLYYMQLVKGFETNVVTMTPRVVVIDDPISSLDSQVIYVVGEMINELISQVRENSTQPKDNGIKQIIILTHNRTFHKQVSGRQRRKDTNYWKLIKQDGVSKVRAYGSENPVYGDYETHWKDLKEMIANENYTGVPNVMRTIIESYFVGFGGMNKRKLIPDHFSEDAEEMAIVKSLAKWMDEGSHRAGDDMYLEDPELTTKKYMKVFKQLFEKLGHGAHYNMMMREDVHHHE